MLHTDFDRKHKRLHRERGFIGAILGAVLPTVVGSIFGGKQASAQTDALREARSLESGFKLQLLDFYKEVYDEGGELRDIALAEAKRRSDAAGVATDLLLEDIGRKPGTSPEFQFAAKAGTKSILQTLAPLGLTDSTTSGEALRGLTTDLLAKDIGDIRRSREAVSGRVSGASPTAGQPSPTGLLQLAGQSTSRESELIQSEGRIRGDLFGARAKDLSGLTQDLFNLGSGSRSQNKPQGIGIGAPIFPK